MQWSIRVVAAVALAILMMPAFALGASSAKVEADGCAQPIDVPGQGPSCREGDLWRIKLWDGTTMLTHGPDPVPSDDDLAASSGPGDDDGGDGLSGLSHVDMHCVEDPTEPYIVLVYARPSNVADRYDTQADVIRGLARSANERFYDAGAALGADVRLRLLCVDGEPVVHHEILATPTTADSFLTITSELRAHGHTLPNAKYWVWYDARISGIGGQGNLESDSQGQYGNANNKGPHYAVTYGYNSWFIMLHELGHVMGAVQDPSPNSSGAGHCNDGRDIMCYNDGGPTADYSGNVCPSPSKWDCNSDDYFHPRPAQGTYLWDHWNLASALHKFTEHVGGCGPVQGEPSVDTYEHTGERVVVQIPILDVCGGRYFRLVGALTSSFDICWYSGTVQLACHIGPGAKTGEVPGGTDGAEITMRRDAGFFTLGMN